MNRSLESHRSREELAMIIVAETASALKRFVAKAGINQFAQRMAMRMVLAFILHRGRMSCSQAAGMIASEVVHRGQVTRFLARPRWQAKDINETLRNALLQMESVDGTYVFIVDATLTTQSGAKTENTYSTTRRKNKSKKKGRHYKERTRTRVHSFTGGLLITPSGIRIPFQVPHYTKEYCKEYDIDYRTTAESAADMIRTLPVPADAEVVVLGDTAYDAKTVRDACDEREYIWVFPVNPERVYDGAKGHRPKVRSRLKDWTNLSLKTIRLRASTGKYSDYRRLSRWRIGPKQKTRVFYAHQEKCDVRNVGSVQLIFSTMKPDVEKATPDNVKILMTNGTDRSISDVIELYSLRWQIELFFKELKSTLGFSQYTFEKFQAVEAWVNLALTTVLFLEYQRARKLADRRLSEETRRWWKAQRLHGLCEAFRQECAHEELKYYSDRLKTSGGIAKMKRLLTAAVPPEFRTNA